MCGVVGKCETDVKNVRVRFYYVSKGHVTRTNTDFFPREFFVGFRVTCTPIIVHTRVRLGYPPNPGIILMLRIPFLT